MITMWNTPLLQQYFKVHKLTQAKIYLASKRMSNFSSGNEETEDLSMQTVTSPLLKTNPQRQHDKGRLWRQKYAAVDQVEILNDKENKDKC